MVLKKNMVERAIDTICDVAAEYDKKLAGRIFTIIYMDRIRHCIDYKQIRFLGANFQHLTGIKYLDDIKPGFFWKLCLNHKLSPKKVIFRKDGFTQMKLAVLPYLPKLLYNNFWIGESLNNDITINADYYVGDTKCIMSLGIRTGKEDFPVSLKKQSIKEVVKKENNVLAVYSRKISDRHNCSCCYRHKDFLLGNLKDDDIIIEIIGKL